MLKTKITVRNVELKKCNRKNNTFSLFLSLKDDFNNCQINSQIFLYSIKNIHPAWIVGIIKKYNKITKAVRNLNKFFNRF